MTVQRGAYLRRHVADTIASIRMASSHGVADGYSDGYGAALTALEQACGLQAQPAHPWQPTRHAYLRDDLAGAIGGIAMAVQSSNADPLFAAGAEDALAAASRAFDIAQPGSQRTVTIRSPRTPRLGR
jgi:hypothetical protein